MLDAPFTLNGLNDNRAGLFRDQIVDALLSVELSHPYARDQRHKGVLVLRIARHAQSTHASPMKGVLEANDFVLVARRVIAGLTRSLCPPLLSNFARNLERAFVGLCARIREEDLGSIKRRRIVAFCKFYQEFCELSRVLVMVEVACVEQFSGLILQDLHSPMSLARERLAVRTRTLSTPSSACPNALTAIPALKSKYFRPVVSQTHDPFPWDRTKGARA